MANPNLKAGPGRPKGLQNKVTSDVKQMILGALAAKGGQKWIEEQMDKNPTAFLTLLGRVVPSEIKGDVKSDVVVSVVRFTDANYPA